MLRDPALQPEHAYNGCADKALETWKTATGNLGWGFTAASRERNRAAIQQNGAKLRSDLAACGADPALTK